MLLKGGVSILIFLFESYYNSMVLFCINLKGCRINVKVCVMYSSLFILALVIILVHAAQLYENSRLTSKSVRLSGNDINSLLSKRMHVKENTRNAIEIDRMLLRHGYSFVTPIHLVQNQEGSLYSFNELASNGKRYAAFMLCRKIKALDIEGIKEVKIPKPGFCSIHTEQDVSYASLQKVFTLLGVHQCDIVEQSSFNKKAEVC
jgi:hypothetical protein